MNYLLSLETATEVCAVALHGDGQLVGAQQYHLTNSHSELLPQIIKDLIDHCGIKLQDLKALAISSGPGSYTGLRIGTSTLKGMAYAMNVPLIAVETLDAMNESVRPYLPAGTLSCPMIDARRMEVYTAIYASSEKIKKTEALIVQPNSLERFADHPMVLFGNGADKTKEVLLQPNLRWMPHILPDAIGLGRLAWIKYQAQAFADLAYFEPFYLKSFQEKPAKKLI